MKHIIEAVCFCPVVLHLLGVQCEFVQKLLYVLL
jgi:hypothetical protein